MHGRHLAQIHTVGCCAAVKRNKKDLYQHGQLTWSEKQQCAKYYQAVKHLNVFVSFCKKKCKRHRKHKLETNKKCLLRGWVKIEKNWVEENFDLTYVDVPVKRTHILKCKINIK